MSIEWAQAIIFFLAPLFFMLLLIEIDDDDDFNDGMMIHATSPNT